MPLQLLFLGSGTSAGIPMIGCRCDVCRSADPRDNRTRPSVLVSYPDGDGRGIDRRVLIDAAQDMRIQMTRHDVCRVDGVLITHAHADHVFGLDDLRRFNVVMDAPITVYAEPQTIAVLRRIFSYIFEKHRNVNKSFIADLILQPISPNQTLDLFGAVWTPIRLLHGRLPILGFRVDCGGASLAYCTDVSSFPPEAYPLLSGLDVLVVDSLRYRHHPTHLTVDQAIEQIDQMQPKRAYLTHMAHDVSHADLESRLPSNVYLAFDGLTVNCGEPGPSEQHDNEHDERALLARRAPGGGESDV